MIAPGRGHAVEGSRADTVKVKSIEKGSSIAILSYGIELISRSTSTSGRGMCCGLAKGSAECDVPGDWGLAVG